MRIASALDAWDGYGKCNCRADSFAVFENIIAFAMELFGWPRKKSVLVSAALIIVLSMPAVLGYNVLSGIQPLGEGREKG